MTEKQVTVEEMLVWDKRYKLSSNNHCNVIDTYDNGEYWTVHPNESYNLCIDLNNLFEENEKLKKENKELKEELLKVIDQLYGAEESLIYEYSSTINEDTENLKKTFKEKYNKYGWKEQ